MKHGLGGASGGDNRGGTSPGKVRHNKFSPITGYGGGKQSHQGRSHMHFSCRHIDLAVLVARVRGRFKGCRRAVLGKAAIAIPAFIVITLRPAVTISSIGPQHQLHFMVSGCSATCPSPDVMPPPPFRRFLHGGDISCQVHCAYRDDPLCRLENDYFRCQNHHFRHHNFPCPSGCLVLCRVILLCILRGRQHHVVLGRCRGPRE